MKRISTRLQPIALGCSLLWCMALSGAEDTQPARHTRLPDFDARIARARQPCPPEAERGAAIARLQAAVPDASVAWDRFTGTPRWVISRNGFLTGPMGQGRGVSPSTARTIPIEDPHRAIKAFLNEHEGLFGYAAAALDSARVTRDFITCHNQVHTVVWQQEVDALPVLDGLLIAHTTHQGELVALSSRFIPEPQRAAARGHPRGVRHPHQPKISAEQALIEAARHTGTEVALSEVKAVAAQTPAPHGYQFYSVPARISEAYVRLVWLPLDRCRLRLCHEVILTSQPTGTMFRMLIDTETGEMLLRHNLTTHLQPVSFLVYTNDSPSPLTPGHATPLTNQPPQLPRSRVTLTALDTNASPQGWIPDGENHTQGNNVDAYLDRDGDNLPDGPRPQGSPYREFQSPLDLSQDPTSYGDAAVVQLFYWCNWMHDRLYGLGFTEAAGNFQNNNFGRGGSGNDALRAQAQDGGATNNSRFFPTTDGIPPRLEIYLFDGTTPKRDADLDAQIVLHEYTHGLTSRLVGGGTTPTADQTKGLAEGWSDFYPLALLSEPGDDLNGTYPIGAYVALREPSFLQNYYFGARRYPYSTDLSKSPLTFKDIDPLQASNHATVPRNPLTTNHPDYSASSPYSIGELWCSALWDMRANMINQYGHDSGNQLALQLVTDALNFTPPDATLLQARHAILIADRAGFAGVHFYDIWAAFAKRGMGYSAWSPPSTTTIGVREAKDVPDTLQVTPTAGFVSSGPVGGGFTPNSRTYTLTNFWTNGLLWAAFPDGSWLSLSATSGTLAVSAPEVPLAVSVNSSASALPAGLYTNTVTFTNLTTGASLAIPFILRVGQPDFLTEMFSEDDNDLDYQTLTFTPDGSLSYYSVCRQTATNFPTDPSGGIDLDLTDDSFSAITVLDGKSVSLYGSNATVLFVGSNGYLTFGAGDRQREPNLTNHFDRLRISVLFEDLAPNAGGRVTWRQLDDRLAITFLGVPEYNTLATNSFQAEIFFDGTIRLTYVGIAATGGLVGLSAGEGLPPNFFESDFTAYSGCAEPLFLTIPSSATEGDGLLAGQGQLRILAPVATNLPVYLTSGDPDEVMTPASVDIPAGRTNADFDLTIRDDPLLDGTRVVAITASAANHRPVTNYLAVFDNEFAILTLLMPTNAIEGIPASLATLNVSAPPAVDVQVRLTTSYTDEILVPDVVTIPAGKTSVVFAVTVIDDDLIDGPQTVTVTAHVENWTDATAPITIQDNDLAILRVILPATSSEEDGLLRGAGVIRLLGLLPTNLLVSLASSHPSQLEVPAVLTITAGVTAVNFDLDVKDNSVTNIPPVVTVTASAKGFSSGSATMTVQDDETPGIPANPSPPHLATDIPVYADLYWSTPERELIINGGFESGDFSGWIRENGGPGDFYVNDGTRDPVSADGPLPPRSGSYSAMTDQFGPSRHILFQDLTIPGGAASVRLRWFHRLRNHAGLYASNQSFRVEIRDTVNNLLAVPFATSPSDPRLTDWILHNYDLSPFRGQQIRLAFVEEDGLGYFNVHLDDVSVVISAPNATLYDVYFGTEASPTPAQWLGTTSNLSWNLPPLSPLTTYYWQVVARRTGQSSSPVWRFTTRGVHHFDWDPVPSPQHQYQPFTVTITARDELGNIVTNFTEAVALSARVEAADLALGDPMALSPFPLAASYHDARTQVIYLANELAGPRRFTALALQVAIAPGHTLTNWTIRMKHTSADHYAEAQWDDEDWVMVYQDNQTINEEGWIYFPFDIPFDYNGLSHLMIDFSFNNFSRSSAGVCVTFTTSQPRSAFFGTDSHYGDPLNWSGPSPRPALTNQVPLLRLTPDKPPLAVAPVASGLLEDGRWTGQVMLGGAASNATLAAHDASGHLGRSSAFAVLPGSELRIVDGQWLGQDFQIGFASVTGTTYRVLGSDSLSVNALWSPITNDLPGTGGILRVIDRNAAARLNRFYRVRIVP